MSTTFLSLDQLNRALAIEEKIQTLRVELTGIYAEANGARSPALRTKSDRRTGKRSAATRAKIGLLPKFEPLAMRDMGGFR